MILQKKDINKLKEWGVKESDFEQIERATHKSITTYTLNDKNITREKAIELLGREAWLSGILRSAFHWTAARIVKDGNNVIIFDSSKLFR